MEVIEVRRLAMSFTLMESVHEFPFIYNIVKLFDFTPPSILEGEYNE